MKPILVFDNLWKRLVGELPTRPPVSSAEVSSAEQMRVLEGKLNDTIEQLSQRVASYKKSHGIATERDYTPDERVERESAVIQANVDRLMASVMDVHARLDSGFTTDRVAHVASAMQGLVEHASVISQSMPERLAAGVRARIYDETGALAWTTLEQCMREHGVLWPDVDGLGPSPSAEQIENARAISVHETRRAFLGSTPQEVADLARGRVRVWKTTYPEEGTWLWSRVALQSVAAAFWCFYVGAAQALYTENREALEAQVVEILGKGIANLQELLKGSVDPSLQSQVTFRMQEIVTDVIPTIVWRHVGAKLASLKPGPETDALFEHVEPVLVAS